MSSRDIAEELIRKNKSTYMDPDTGIIVVRFDLGEGDSLLDVTTPKGGLTNLPEGSAVSVAGLLIQCLIDSGHAFSIQAGWDIVETDEGRVLTRRVE